MYRISLPLTLSTLCLAIAGSPGPCSPSLNLDDSTLRTVGGGQIEYGWCWPIQGCDLADRPCDELRGGYWCLEDGHEGAVCDEAKEYQYPEACSEHYGNAMCGDLPVTVENVICLTLEKCKCITLPGIGSVRCLSSGDYYDPVTDAYDTDRNCAYSTDYEACRHR